MKNLKRESGWEKVIVNESNKEDRLDYVTSGGGGYLLPIKVFTMTMEILPELTPNKLSGNPDGGRSWFKTSQDS
ncbi:hypothetical protein Tco_1013808 [Tanacetum coccineum]